MTTATRPKQTYSPASISVWIVCVLTVLALLVGTDLQNMVENQTHPLEHAGVTAQLPGGWLVQEGLASEQTVFTARDPFTPNLSYSASLVPTTPDIKPSDLAFTINLQRGQDLTLFRTIDQSQEKVNGKDALRVHYAYVDPNSQTNLPVVVEGVEYIFLSQPKALVVAVEANSSQFGSALPAFMRFLGTVDYHGGNQ